MFNAAYSFHSSFSKEIEILAKPLQLIDLAYFHFVRVFPDNSRISLSNNSEWMQHYCQKEYYANPAIEKSFHTSGSKKILWASIEDSVVLEDLSENFDIANGLTLSQKQTAFCDFFYFGAKRGNKKIQNFFINNMHLIEKYCHYFTSHGEKIITLAEQSKIPSSFLQNKISKKESKKKAKDYTNLSETFSKEIEPKSIKIFDGFQKIQLSSRELHCIEGILNGKTAKMIAAQYGLSNRTIENYIYNLKIKLGCHSKVDLRKKIAAILGGLN